MESSLTSDSTGRASNRLLSMKKLARRLIAAIHIEAAKTSHNARLPFTSFDHESVFNFLVVDWTNDWRHPVLTRFSAAHLTSKVCVIRAKIRPIMTIISRNLSDAAADNEKCKALLTIKAQRHVL